MSPPMSKANLRPGVTLNFAGKKGPSKVAIYSSLLKVRTKQFSVRHRDDSARPTWNSNRVPVEWLDFTRENSPINSKCDRTLTTGLGTEPDVVRIAYMLIVKAAADALPSLLWCPCPAHGRTVYARRFYEPDAFSRQDWVMERAGKEGQVSHSFNERKSLWWSSLSEQLWELQLLQCWG